MKITDVQQNREQLADFFNGVGVEVGVEQAAFSKRICELKPETKLYGVDPLKAYKGYREHVTQSKLDGFYEKILERMAPFNFQFIRKFSLVAVHEFPDNNLDFVYIDANHDYKNVLEDVTAWAQKVKPGGIVSGHDYIRRKGQKDLFDVVDAVNDYVDFNQIPELFIYRGDKSPSWMFVKP